MPRLVRELPFVLLSAAAVGLCVLLLLAISGHLVSEPSVDAGPAPATKPAPQRPRTRMRTTAAVVESAPVTTTAARPAATQVSVAASRGDCWLEVRKASADGAVLFSGVLQQGETKEFSARRVWLRFGAAGNVDVTADGEAVAIPSGTSELTLPA